MPLLRPGARGRLLRRSSFAGVVIVGLYVLLYYSIAFYAAETHTNPEPDFLAFYTGATIARDGDLPHLYDAATQLAIEQELEPGRGILQPYLNPPIYAVLLSPLAGLSPKVAYSVAVAAALVVLGGCAVLLWHLLRRGGVDRRRCTLFIGGFLLTPVLWQGVWEAQPSILIVAAVLLSLLVAPRRPLWAGVLLTTLVIKPQLVPAFALALVARPRMLAGLGLGLVVVCVVSAVMLTPHGMADALSLYNAELGEPSATFQQNWTGFAYSFLPAPAITGAAGTIVLAAVTLAGVYALRFTRLPVLYGAAALAAIIGNQHVHAHDLVLLVVTGVAVRAVFRAPALLIAGYYVLFVACLIASRAETSVTIFPLFAFAVWYWREARGTAVVRMPSRISPSTGLAATDMTAI